MAPGRGRSSLGWFFICFCLPLIGQVLLTVRSSNADDAQRGDATSTANMPVAQISGPTAVQALAAPVRQPSSPPQPTIESLMAGLPSVSPAARWHYLVEYDPVLRDAAQALSPLGPVAIETLRDAFFALQDRSLVPSIVARIQEKHAPPQPTLRRDDVLAQLMPRPVEALSAPPTLAKRAVAEPPLRTLVESMPATAARLVPRHTTVTPQDLDTAVYRETHRGVHLYQLNDGRIYIDGQFALASLDAARNRINQAMRNTILPQAEPQGVAMHS